MKVGSVVGVAPAHDLGDLLQYYCAIILLSKYLQDYEISLLLRDIKGCLAFEKIRIMFSNVKPVEFYPIRADIIETIAHFLLYSSRIKMLPKTFRLNLFGLTSAVNDLLEPTIVIDQQQFIAFGGHTFEIDNPVYINLYKKLRRQTKVLITFPISIDTTFLRLYGLSDILRKRLAEAFKVFDHIFVRGIITKNILSNVLDEDKVDIALDSGFYIKDLIPIKMSISNLNGEGSIAIVPRSYTYKGDTINFMIGILNVIKWLLRAGYKVFLSSMAFKGDKSLILEITKYLGDLRNSKNLRIVSFSNFDEAFQFYSSMDLILTGRMHDGIMALSAGRPAIFIFPRFNKVTDILLTLKLAPSLFLISPENSPLELQRKLLQRIEYIRDNYESVTKMIRYGLEKAHPTIDFPAKKIKSLIED
ncbi:MAG: polysaccharide pyruvyl transferase family protein [Candidatus Bathyarchaeia archaeon]